MRAITSHIYRAPWLSHCVLVYWWSITYSEGRGFESRETSVKNSPSSTVVFSECLINMRDEYILKTIDTHVEDTHDDQKCLGAKKGLAIKVASSNPTVFLFLPHSGPKKICNEWSPACEILILDNSSDPLQPWKRPEMVLRLRPIR